LHKKEKALILLFLVGLLVLVCMVAGPYLTYASSEEEYDYVDNNVSDVDSSPDKGTHSNFTAQQFGPDDSYDTLTEGGSIADFKVKQGTFVKATTTGTQTVSGVGFQPKAIIFWWTRQTSYGELAAVHIGYGMATYYGGAYQNRGVAFASDDAAATSNTGKRRSETYCIIILSNGAPTLAAQASVTAFNSDGFVLNWQTNEARADIIDFVAFGGTDLTNARAGTFSLTTSTGTQAVTGVGFQPDFVMFLWSFNQTADSNSAHAEIGVGFAGSSTKRGSMVANSEDGRGTMDTWQQQRNDSCILLLTPTTGAQDAIVDFVSMDNDGFTVTKSDAPAYATPIFYLALDGGQYDVGNFNSPTATGDQDITGIPFQPRLVMLATQGRSAGTAIGSTAELALGAATSSTQRGCTWFEDPDNLADSDNEQETLNTKIIQWRDRTAANTFTLRGSADFNSFLPNGFRLSWSNVETAGRQVIYAAFGGSVNYELDLEVQWTNATYTRTNEELCIKTGTTSAEDIKVYVWNATGSSWHLILSDLTANSWNNISVTSYLTSSTFTVRFLGGTETGDTSQDTWQIDCTLLHTWGVPPVANFSFSPEHPYQGDTVTFNASASYDPDGVIVSYFWGFGDGTNATGDIATHIYTDDGIYTVTLTVTDNDTLSDTTSANVTVLNKSPIATFTESAETVYTGETITFNASNSYDPDGSIVNYFWNFGDGTNATSVIASHAYADDGVYTVTLTVTDDDGATASQMATKTILNRAPVASFTESATTVRTGEVIYFDASGSYDSDGVIVSYFWDFGDGTNASGVVVDHAYADDGTYTVTLRVTDNDGATATATATKMVLNRPPVALFTESATVVYTGEVIAFNASSSYDPDGSIVNYFWSLGDGTNATGVTVTHAYADNGTYVVTLIVTDNEGATATATATKTILNRPPMASFAESATTVYTGEIIYFNASTSYDPDGSVVNFFWNFGDGTNATGVTVSHAYSDDGVYNVTLTVTDNDGATALASAVKTILNRAPVAVFTESATTVFTGEVIYFNASGSYDLDGSIVSYFWTFGDGINVTGINVSHAYADDGVYTVTLTVKDDDDATASMSATKTVLNRPPVASFTESATTVYTGEIIYFDASTSYDPDGSIISYLWNFGDGTNTTGIVVDHAYADNGSYTVVLTVKDNDGATATATAIKTVLNRPPVASFTESATTVYRGQVINFNASTSYDSDGSIVGYFWDFGDGTNTTGMIVDHAYTNLGTYTVTLTVKDNDGATGTATATKTVVNRPPVALFTESATTAYTGQIINFNASSSYDPDGFIVSYFWTFGDGTNSSGTTVGHAYTDNGVYTVTLTVTDNEGATAKATATKTILNRPPVASFTESATIVLTGEVITFNASDSYDPDGVIISYQWNFGDGNITTVTNPIITHVYADNGTYTVTLTVIDNDNATESISDVKTVLNRAPVAIFTESATTVYTLETITFNASASYDPDGSIVSYQWNFGDGNITVVTYPIITHAYAENGTYTVTLTINDNDGATSTASSTKTVVNRPPVASFTESATTVFTGELIYFNASNSYDLDGSIVSYFWTFGDGANVTGAAVSHAYLDNGIYTVTLTVTDNDGATASTSATKTVLNRSPVASFTESATTVLTGEVIYFNASGSYDFDGSIVSYFWTFGDGTNATGINVSHAYADNGVYTVTLIVTDDDGTMASTSATKTVLNRPPIASFTESATIVYTGEIIYFNASASYDLDGFIVNFFWTFGDGSNATDVTVTHAYIDNGTYVVTLTVTDNDGATASNSSTKTVLNRPPTAIFTESAEAVYTGEIITFNASGSYDQDGMIISYFWDFGDGSNATGTIVNHAYADNGVYAVTLTVTDDDGATATASATKTVGNRPPVASFSESATTVLTGETIYFNASGSYDPDGTITNYFWTFGDGTNGTGMVVTHAYVDNGTYVVTLTVTDNDGATASKTAIKTVLNRPPVASFTESATTVYTGEVIYFNASTSYDPDGSIVSYFWNFGDGTNTTGITVSHAYANNGNYTVTLTVKDNDGAISSSSAIKTVLNRAPVAVFTESATTVLTSEVIYFNASGSYDSDGTIVSYFWTFGDGTNATGINVSHAYADNGVYTVTLTIKDDDGATASVSATKTVLNRPPVALFTESATTVYTGEIIYFDASASYDPDGSIISYLWNFGDGTNATGIVVDHFYADNGSYTVILTVRDNDGATATATAMKTVLNRAPVASFTESATMVYRGQVIHFNASASYDSDGSIVGYFWDFGDGTNATGMVVDHAYTNLGTYTVTLTVKDNDGATGTATATKTVVNRPPVALFTESSTTAYTGEAIYFNASSSYDPDGVIVSYFWTFGDGTNATGVTVNHAYAENGTYTVTLTVTDDQGATATATATKTVLNRPPVASFTESATTVYTYEAITFNATSSYDPDGSIVSYTWNFGDGNVTTLTSPMVTHTYADNGTYTVILTVTDNDGATATATATKNVLNRAPVASFIESASVVQTGEVITFNASGSYDLDGFIVSYFWTFGDGTNATGLVVTHAYADNGTYVVTLTVTDNDGATASKTATKTVLNRSPVASFTESATTVYTGEIIYFNASASYDPDGSIVSYFWDFGDGTNTTGMTVSHAYANNGNYTVTLTVKDNDDATSSSSAIKIVLNRAPVAVFTESATTVLTGEVINFNASGSYDLDGSIVSYFWAFGDGTNATGITVSHAYIDNGVYTVTLTVKDDDSATASTSATKTVLNRPPIASFEESATRVYTGEIIYFNASSSYDPDGSIVSYFWSFGDGTNATGVTVTHAYADNGTYIVTLTVTDNDGATASNSSTKTVLNRPPTAIFTESAEAVYTGEIITFNASGSYDPDGMIVSYFWAFGDGTNATGTIVNHAYADNGVYTVTLTVTDNDGATATASAIKTVGNRPPIPLFTESATTVFTNEIINFNASGSYDPDGTIVKYFWDFGDGTNATGVTTGHAYGNDGNYTVTLTITDNDGASASASSTKTVLNRPPVASFTESATKVYTGTVIYFDASASYDPDGTILKYFWNFGDGTNATGVTLGHSYADDGNYTVTLTVTDNDGATGVAMATKTILNRSPVAIFTESATKVYTGTVIYFDASASYDSDGFIVGYLWDFGDGINATGVTTEHAYADNGSYVVTLRVTDDDGATSVTTATKIVLNRPPVASFTESAKTVYTSEIIRFNASASYDPDGTIISYFWDFGDNTNTTGIIVNHAYSENGNYTVTLTVADNDGATASTNATKTVLNRPPVALFTESAETVFVGETIYFNASASYDSDGVIVSYFWTFGDGTNATGVTTEHAYADNGGYTVKLTITDNDGATASATATKNVAVTPPVAVFTESAETVYTWEVIHFNASGSYDPDGVIVSYLWRFGDGSNTTGVTVEHAYTDDGNYTVTLTVTDDDGATDTATSTKTILNRSPVALFIYSPGSPAANETITFNASNSYDQDGYIITYKWDFGDGNITTVDTSTITHVYTTKGDYTVTLTVTDDDNATGITTHMVTVGKWPPVAVFNYSPDYPIAGETVTFNASDSYDPDGNIVSYVWDFGDDNTTTVNKPIITHVYMKEGNYTVVLTVTDNDGFTDTMSDIVPVEQAPPVAAFTYSPSIPFINETVTFNASASYDPNGYIVSYTWNFGDGSPQVNETDPIITHVYVTTGDYNVTLTVTDSEGLTDTITQIITVSQAPVAVFTFSPSFPIVGETVFFNASDSYDPDGYLVSYVWNFGDGNVTTVKVPLVTHSYIIEGNYTVKLTVVDNEGFTDTTPEMVRIRNYPTATFTYSPEQPIAHEYSTFNASSSRANGGVIANYTWDFGDGNITTVSNAIIHHTYSAYGNYTVTLNVTDSEGLSDIYARTVNVRDYPIASFTYTPAEPSVGDTVTFNASSSTPNGGEIVSYWWNFGDGSSPVNKTDPITIHLYSAAGNYAVTLIITDNEQLSGNTTKILTYGRSPEAIFTFSPSFPIVGETVVFNASGSYDLDGNITDYTWDFGDGNITTINASIITHAYMTEGNYTVTLTVIDNDGFDDTAYNIVRVRNYPTASFTYAPKPAVVNKTVTFDASSSRANGGVIANYTWDFGDGNITTVSTTIVTHIYPYEGNYTVTLTVIDSEELTNSQSQTVTVCQPPTASFTYTPVKPIAGDVVTFNASASYDPNGYIVYYTWNFGDGNITTVDAPVVTHVYGVEGYYTANLTVTDNDGYKGTMAKTVWIRNYPIAVFTLDPDYPITGEGVTFDASSSTPRGGSIVRYQWDFGDGSPSVNTTNPTITHVYATIGNYTVTLTVTDSEELSGTTSTIVSVRDYPTAAFTYTPKPPTAGLPVNFNGSLSSPGQGGTITSYEWNFGDGNITTTTMSTIIHVYAKAGNYTVTLTVTDSEALSDSDVKLITAQQAPPVASFVYSPDPAVKGGTVTFNASGSYDPDGKIRVYYWKFGDGEIIIEWDPVATHVYTAAGQYNVTLTVEDLDRNTDTTSKTITVIAGPYVDFTWEPESPEIDEVVTFDASASYDPDGYIINYSWDFGDGNITMVSEPIITHQYIAPAYYTVTLNVTNNRGVWNIREKLVSVIATGPYVEFAWTPCNPYVNETITFDATNSTAIVGEIVSYTWHFGDGEVMTVVDPIINHTYLYEGNYTVTLNVTDSRGLWSVTSKMINILPLGGPTASFTWHPSFPKPNETVTFNASGSTLGWNGTHHPPIVSYTWDFGDGNVTTVTYPVVNHTYETLGKYNVTLTVMDSAGLENKLTRTINVLILLGDINGDGKVDMRDIFIVARAFGSEPGHPRWDPRADINGDGRVDMRDVYIVARNFGRTV